jgi:hypothetical protein
LVASQRKISLAGSGVEFSGIHSSRQSQVIALFYLTRKYELTITRQTLLLLVRRYLINMRSCD